VIVRSTLGAVAKARLAVRIAGLLVEESRLSVLFQQ
jgi:hypothetical protein